MIRTLALLCLIAAPAIESRRLRPAIVVDYEYVLPSTDKQAASIDWVQMNPLKRPAGLEVLKLWCNPSNLRVCALMDDTGFIAGTQVNLDKAIFTDNPFDWTVQGFATWTATDENGEKKEFWAISQYYVSPEFLKIDPDKRIANRTLKGTVLQDKSVWVSSFNGALYEISRNISSIGTEGSDFTVQREQLMAKADKSYYYKMSPQLECRSDTVLPWFVEVLTDVISAQLRFLRLGVVGVYVLVSQSVVDANEEYFGLEYTDIEYAIPHGPKCLYDFGNSSYLLFSVHIYVSTMYTEY